VRRRIVMGIKAFLHVKLDIRNVRRSLEFYCDKLKLKEICRYDVPNGVIIQLSPTGESPGIELWYEEPLPRIENDRIHIAFDIDDVVSFTEELKGQGIEIEREPFRIGHEVIAFIRDPDGYLIELNQDTRSTSQPA
jgi:lactoylglutathione lyase